MHPARGGAAVIAGNAEHSPVNAQRISGGMGSHRDPHPRHRHNRLQRRRHGPGGTGIRRANPHRQRPRPCRARRRASGKHDRLPLRQRNGSDPRGGRLRGWPRRGRTVPGAHRRDFHGPAMHRVHRNRAPGVRHRGRTPAGKQPQPRDQGGDQGQRRPGGRQELPTRKPRSVGSITGHTAPSRAQVTAKAVDQILR